MYTFFGVNFILRNFVCVKEMTNIRYDPDPPVVTEETNEEQTPDGAREREREVL